MSHTNKVPLAFGIVLILFIPNLGNLAMPVDAAGSRSIYLTTRTFRVSSMPGATMRMK